jgi:hypothetical protein
MAEQETHQNIPLLNASQTKNGGQARRQDDKAALLASAGRKDRQHLELDASSEDEVYIERVSHIRREI